MGRSETVEIIEMELGTETLDFAYKVAGRTLVGVSAPFYPYPAGNCFSVETTPNKTYRVLNFVWENLDYALKRKYIEWPIQIKILSPAHCVIHDERIPDSWYQEKFCETCTPRELFPLPQLLRIERQEKQGVLSKSEQGWIKVDPYRKPVWE